MRGFRIPRRPLVLRLFARAIDTALEATILGSFTKAGYRVRSWAYGWDAPSANLEGQRALVTGSSSGIGNAIAAGLMRLGAHVLVTSRSAERAEAAAAELVESVSTGAARGLALDTGDFASIDRVVEDVRASGGALDVLICNAGALTPDYRRDDNGVELTLSTHLVGHYRLMMALRPRLSVGARVLWMSSGGMYTQGLDVDALQMSEEGYQGAVAYARAKRAQVELVHYLGPRWAPDVVMHAVHPGWVDTPGVDAGLPGFGKLMGPTLRTPEQGADTMVWLATTSGLDRDGGPAPPGLFWLDRAPRRTRYLPGTATTDGERQRLIEWLDEFRDARELDAV